MSRLGSRQHCPCLLRALFLSLTLTFAVTLAACGNDPVETADTAAVTDVSGDEVAEDADDGVDSAADAVTDAGDTVVGLPCKIDVDCANAGGKCNTYTYLCGECVVSADCKTQPAVCEASLCVAQTPCTASADCKASGKVCDPTDNVCVACVTSSDCAQGLECHARLCLTPGPACASTNDCKGGKVCDKAAGKCAECAVDGDCEAYLHCEEGVCSVDACGAGQTQCDAQDKIRKCKSNGSGWVVETCPENEVCASGLCQSPACDPGSKACEGNDVITCNATGLGWSTPKACEGNDTCQSGQCVSSLCVADEKKCGDGAVLVCKSDGNGWTVAPCPIQPGTPGQACVLEGGVPKCIPLLCASGMGYCEGTMAMKCAPDGMSADLVTDCGTVAKQICSGGQCGPQKCNPGDQICADPGTQAVCVDGSVGWTKKPCPEGSGCTDGVCLQLLCPAAEFFCEGNVLQECSESGTSATLIEDCAVSGNVCYQGKCSPLLCKAGATQCKGGQIDTCDQSGMFYTASDCPDGETCAGGLCKPIICQAGVSYCETGKSMKCDPTGTATTVAEACAGAKPFCLDGVCSDKACVPGVFKCDGTTLKTCKPDGSAWSDQSCVDPKPCTNDICDPVAGKCKYTAKNCDDANACTTETCDAVKGCLYVSVVNGTACNDQNACTASDACEAGSCKGGTAACDDGNACTDDSCDPQSGCKHMGNIGLCTTDDGACGQCANSTCTSLGPSKVWDRVFATASTGYTPTEVVRYALAALPDGGAVVAGTTKVANGLAATLLRVSDKSQVSWEKQYPMGTGTIHTVVRLSDGGFALGGTISESGVDKALLIRVKDDGESAVSTFYSQQSDTRGLIALPDGGVAMYGNLFKKACYLALIKDDGTKVGTGTTYEAKSGAGTDDQECNGIARLPDGSFVMVATVLTTPTKVMVRKVDSTGKLLYSKLIEAPQNLQGLAVVTTPDGGIGVSGSVFQTTGSGHQDVWLARLTQTVELVFQRTFGGMTRDEAVSLVALSDGGFALFGRANSLQVGGPAWWLIRTNAGGAALWKQVHAAKYADYRDATGIDVRPGGGFLLVGAGTPVGSAAWKPRLIATDPWGNASCATSGQCAELNASGCDDQKQCTADICTAAEGCHQVSLPEAAPCGQVEYCDALKVCKATKCGGNGCEPGETLQNCPQDCPATCGDGKCTPGESAAACAKDCAGCVKTATAGCTNCGCSACVCAKDPLCCSTAWDDGCVVLCNECSPGLCK